MVAAGLRGRAGPSAAPKVPRVVHIVSNLCEGGAETLVRTLCRRLGGEGIDVTVVSIYPSRLDPAEKAALGVPVVELERAGRFDFGFYPRLVRTLEGLKPDVVHAHLHSGKYHGRSAAVLAKAPAIVFTEHGDELGGAFRGTLNRWLDPRTTRFIVFTETQRRELARRKGIASDRIAVIANGIERPVTLPVDSRERLGLPRDAFLLFLPARLAHQKNQSLALQTLAYARARGQDTWHLVLAGSGPDEEQLRAQCAALGLENAVSFLGFRRDVGELYGSMDAFLMTSRWEGMPLALAEAMLAGLAVVTTPWEGVDEFVADGVTGAVAARSDERALYEALLRIRDNGVRRSMALAGSVAAARRFDIDRTVAAHASLYRSLMAAKR